MAETYDYYDYDDDYNDADKSAWLDTTDVQGNNIQPSLFTEATKAVLTCWCSLIRKAFANSKPHNSKKK